MSINVLGTPLKSCSCDPMTGFDRNGCCQSHEQDVGMHTVCAVVDEDFLAFSKRQGNDLSTPRPEYDFPGLVPGDKWCLCAPRWVEAYQAGMAPRVDLEATHFDTLKLVSFEVLQLYQVYDASR